MDRRAFLRNVALGFACTTLAGATYIVSRGDRKLTVGTHKPATINVAAFVDAYPPPVVLSLQTAASEVTKASADESSLKVSTFSPLTPTPYSGPAVIPPMIAALERALGQNPPPDIVLFRHSDELATAVERGLLATLDDLARGEEALKADDYFPGTLEAVSARGQLYALPLAAAPLVLQYDRRLFDAEGLAVPDASWDWGTLLKAAKQLTKSRAEGGPQWGYKVWNANWLPALIWQNGGELFTQDGRRSLLADAAAVEAVRYYSDLLHVHRVSPGLAPPGSGASMPVQVPLGEYPILVTPNGRVAMQPVGWNLNGVIASGQGGGKASPHLRLAELPRGTQQATLVEVELALALTRASPNPKVAFMALVALAMQLQGTVLGRLAVPATRSAAQRLAWADPELSAEDARVLLASMEYGRGLPLFRRNHYLDLLSRKLFDPIHSGSTGPADAAREAAQAIDQVLAGPLPAPSPLPTLRPPATPAPTGTPAPPKPAAPPAPGAAP